MKKSLIAMAVLAASGVASAQSTVTLYGLADVYGWAAIKDQRHHSRRWSVYFHAPRPLLLTAVVSTPAASA